MTDRHSHELRKTSLMLIKDRTDTYDVLDLHFFLVVPFVSALSLLGEVKQHTVDGKILIRRCTCSCLVQLNLYFYFDQPTGVHA